MGRAPHLLSAPSVRVRSGQLRWSALRLSTRLGVTAGGLASVRSSVRCREDFAGQAEYVADRIEEIFHGELHRCPIPWTEQDEQHLGNTLRGCEDVGRQRESLGLRGVEVVA